MKHIKKRHLRSEKRWMAVFDFLTICASSTVFGFLCYGRSQVGIRAFLSAILLYGVALMVFMTALDAYKTFVSGLYEQTVIIALGNLYAYVVTVVAELIVVRSLPLMGVLTLFAPAMAILLFVENFVILSILRNPKIFSKPKLLIIETDTSNFTRMRRVKYGTLYNYDSWYDSIDVNDPAALEELIRDKLDGFDAVCLLDKVEDSVYDRITQSALERDIDLYIVPKLKDIGRSNASLSHFDDVITLYIPSYSLGKLNEFFKRAVDIAFGVVMLVLSAIPMAVIALAIKICSPGPVFYKQIRYTKHKKEFSIYKFRTMIPDAEKLSGPVFAKKKDDRITPIGKILRACRLDELPQVINILRGDMSVVGPRPERPFFVEQFAKEINGYNFRYSVKAGLTGLSHVYGRYSTYAYDRTCFDLMYITHYSFLLDLKIILLTTKIMFLKSAAEGEDEFKLAAKQELAK